jgi:hypothetical protein
VELRALGEDTVESTILQGMGVYNIGGYSMSPGEGQSKKFGHLDFSCGDTQRESFLGAAIP